MELADRGSLEGVLQDRSFPQVHQAQPATATNTINAINASGRSRHNTSNSKQGASQQQLQLNLRVRDDVVHSVFLWVITGFERVSLCIQEKKKEKNSSLSC